MSAAVELAACMSAIDEAARAKLASDPSTPASVLGVLALDEAVTVRAAVAMNAAAPGQSDRRLAADPDERVRALLARKIARAVSYLPAAEQGRLGDQVVSVLTALAEDEAVRVRAAIVEVVAGLPGLPRELVLRLAYDEAVSVSEPVLRLSPILSSDDLLALLATPPHHAATMAIARRANLPERVSDIIAAGADTDAIRALLSNDSAAIRESTLDGLIERASGQPAWHEPLVRRPVLPAMAARALSEIVAAHLLRELAARADLDPTLAAELQVRLADYLAPRSQPNADELLMECARALEAAGALGEPALMGALRAGDLRGAAAMLAVAAGVQLAVVDRAARLRSAKGLVSMVWKAGFEMRIAATVQAIIGRINPTAILTVTANGGFPLTPEEMRWQLDFLGQPGR